MKAVLVMAAAFALMACSPETSTADTSRVVSVEESSASVLTPEVVMVPDGFVGRWDASLDACKAGSDMKLTVTQTELTFWESAGRISAVTVTTPDDITIQADFSGEGEQWQRRLHLQLSDAGQALTIDEGKGGVRTRCE